MIDHSHIILALSFVKVNQRRNEYVKNWNLRKLS